MSIPTELDLLTTALDELIIQRSDNLTEYSFKEVEDGLFLFQLKIMSIENVINFILAFTKCRSCEKYHIEMLNMSSPHSLPLLESMEEPLFCILGIPFCNREDFLEYIIPIVSEGEDDKMLDRLSRFGLEGGLYERVEKLYSRFTLLMK